MKLRVNQPVWYTKAKKKAIVKEILKNGFVKITYFDRETDERKVEDVPRKFLRRYRKPLEIKVKYFAEIDEIEQISIGDWIDLRAAETVEMKAGEFKLIPLGVGVKLPKGYEALVAPRSSTFKNFGIIQTNHVGVIDNSYSGNEDQWFYPAYALRDTVIEKNDRICQFRIQRSMPKVKFVKVDKLDEVSRGGHGSTGVK